MRPAPRLLVVLALLVGGVLPGCKPGSALGTRYTNFRAYYNTFYNAERALEEGEATLSQAAVTVDRTRLVPVFPVSETAGRTTGPFQEAIDKSAELLRNRPESKWADDALLVIGKAYFYQRNLVGAEQKFRETMAAAVLADDRRLADEARFWLGRTYALGDRFEEGVTTLEEGLVQEGGDRRWTARMRLALGELYARAGRWDEAAESLRLGAPEEGDADVAARAYVLLGQVEEQAGRFDSAAQAYAEALGRRPAYELAFAAELDRALVLGLDAGDTDAALAIVRAMRADDKHYQRRAEVALAEARLRAAAGQSRDALALFRDVLYDDALSGGSVRGPAHYRLGEFYRDVLSDYIRASAHFDTAATALRAPPGDSRPSRGAILDVADSARTYNTLATSARRMAEVDSLLALGALSEEQFQARIAEIETERRRVYLEEQRQLDALRQAQAFSGGGGTFNERGGQTTTQPVRGGAPAAGPVAAGGGGFLSHRNPASVQAGLIAFQQRWGDRPLVEGWRFRSTIQAGAVGSGRGVVGTDLEGGIGLQGGPPPLDLTAVPRTPAKRDEMITEMAGLRYELANGFFLALGRADTAAALYRQVLADTPDLPIATRARYALAEIERAAGRDDLARPLYEAVAASDTTALGQASRIRLGIEPPPDPAAEMPDLDAETSAAYDAARRLWRAGEPLAATQAFVALADARPDAPDAPRAYLAAAAALIDWAGADSTALRAPLPDSLVSRVLLAVSDSLMAAESELAAPAAPPVAAPPAAAQPGPPQPNTAEIDDSTLVDPEDEDLGIRGEPDDEEIRRPGAPVPVSGEDDERAIPPAPDDEAVADPEAAVDLEVIAAPEDVADLPDAAEAQVDSSAVALADSSIVAVAPAVPDPSAFTLRRHLMALDVRYPGTPFAARARALITMLPAPLRAASPEPVAQADPDDLPFDPASAPDSVGPPRPPDTPLAPSDPDEIVPDAAALAPLRGAGAPDPGEGGFAWLVRTVTLADEASSLVDVLGDAGYRVGLLRARTSGALSILLGQFETAEAAEAARAGLPAWARLRGQIVALDGFDPVATDDAAPGDESGDGESEEDGVEIDP